MYSSNAQPTGTNRPRACPNTLQNQHHNGHVEHDKTCATHTHGCARVHITQPTHPPVDHTPQTEHDSPSLEHPHHTRVWTGCVVTRVTAAIAKGKHPDPSRTRKLSLPAPMVLQPRGCGRVGRRRTNTRVEATRPGGLCCISAARRGPAASNTDRATPKGTIVAEERRSQRPRTRIRRSPRPSSAEPVARWQAGLRRQRRPGRARARRRPSRRRARRRVVKRGRSGSRRRGPAPGPQGRLEAPGDEQRPRTADQATYDGPPLPEDITGASSTGRSAAS